jgi:glutathione synthase/RimK-type ligase-like ATP-grasp enzyme
MERFCTLAALKARVFGAHGVVSNHEQFGALCAVLLAERMQWPGTSVEAVLACQHKLYAREVLQRVAPEANVQFSRLDTEYYEDIPEGLTYPAFVKPVKAAFSVLAKRVNSHQELVEHTRFWSWEQCYIVSFS